MSVNETPKKLRQKTKLFILLLIIAGGMATFYASITKTALKPRHIPRLMIEETNRALRGDILSKDGFKLSFSQKLFKAMINTRNIDPDKKELFVNLFSIYSGIPRAEILKKMRKKGNVVLSYAIDANRAKYLKELARKLRLLGVFIPYKTPSGRLIKYGLSVTESGETRIFAYKNAFTPIIGFMRKYEEDGFTRPTGIKGLEKYYDDALRPLQNGLIRGERDIGNSIILDAKSTVIPPVNGKSVRLNIAMDFQELLEDLLGKAKKEHEAKEITVVIMEAATGKILGLASSERFDPDHIRRKDYDALNVTAAEYTYEPGSVMKPVTFALLLHHHKVNPLEIVRGYNGRYKLGRKVITDEHKTAWLSAEDVITYSSNIGIAQLAQRLDAVEFVDGFKMFGLTKKTGVDLPYEHNGIMPRIAQMRSEIYKATVAYGYGIRATLLQLVRAYNVFNNNGLLIEPKIADALINPDGTEEPVTSDEPVRRIIHPATAARMRRILQKVVAKGTGTKAQIEGLTIGGKTGTAHIAARKGGYARKYNSTFIGFANDRKHRYTIGVLVREAKKPYHYFAAMSAVPVFKQVVELMVKEGYLTPDPSLGHYPKPTKHH